MREGSTCEKQRKCQHGEEKRATALRGQRERIVRGGVGLELHESDQSTIRFSSGAKLMTEIESTDKKKMD